MYGTYKQLERYASNKVIRAAGYGRCSSDEQKKNGYTIIDQTELMDAFCEEYELAVAGRYIDEGISATLEISKRKALAQLIEDAKQGKFDIVIFKCIDRFFRNVGEYYECQKQLKKSGVTWISIEESDLDPEDPDAAFKINIYLTMAEYEAKKTSKRIVFNNKMRIKNRQVVTGSRCFHFPWHVVGEPKNKHLEKDEEKAHILYDLLDHYETHQSKYATVGYINAKYDEVNISQESITNLLKNTLLYGEYKGVPNYVEPYITKARFDKIQEISQRNIRNYPTSYRVFLFASMVRCNCCGWKMIGHANKSSSGRHFYRYRCNNNRSNHGCINNKSISEKNLEAQLLDRLEEFVKFHTVKIAEITDATPKNDNELKIKKLQAEMDRLNVMFRKGRIEEEEYDSDYFALESKMKTLNVEKEEAREIDVEGLTELIESDYRTIYDSLDREHKRAFWHGIIKEFTLDENNNIIPESIVFF